MRKHCGVIMGVILAIVVLGVASPRAAEAVEYIGEVCWTFASQSQTFGVLKFGVVHIGGGHFLLSGGGGPEAWHGNAEISGGNILLTTVSSGSNASYVWSFVGRGVLNASTLNGTLDTMGVGHDKTNPNLENAYTDYDGPFTMTLTTCP